jgi:hypothetical protein
MQPHEQMCMILNAADTNRNTFELTAFFDHSAIQPLFDGGLNERQTIPGCPNQMDVEVRKRFAHVPS